MPKSKKKSAARPQVRQVRQDTQTADGPSDDPPPKSLVEKILSGPRFILATALTVAIGAAIPKIVEISSERFLPEIHAVAKEDDTNINDWSQSTADAIDFKTARQLSGDGDVFNDPAIKARLVKTNLQGVKLIIEGSRTEAVRIVGMRARVLKVAPVVSGTLFQYGPQGGEKSLRVAFDLKSPNPIAREVLNSSFRGLRLGAYYFATQSELLKKGESKVFEITTVAGPHTYEWDIQIDLAAQGRTWSIYRPEKPFRVSGLSQRYVNKYEFNLGPNRWDRTKNK
ncbi:hypothetical protein ACFQVD_36420 [Streptosporangium amethystogenes subsp. fukuiense]|uniref:POTRA domain-containing protein n=1 Tax=Streptosporangium amethystogenes subsp. fukuiense TaxID=698418 RepID=A0ABW2TC26_9ACTN